MIGYVSGIADNDDVTYCPKCGEKIKEFISDGTVKCECGYHFAVIECDED